MQIHRWAPLLAAAFAFGQEPAPFPSERPNPWKPAWELTLRGDQLTNPVEVSDSFRRASVQLRLRWTWELDRIRFEGGTRSALGSDANRFNAPRWDQQPSNGTQLDVARVAGAWVSPIAFGTLSLGFQENGLLTSQALWDRDLRFLGAGGALGLRQADGPVQEAGFRAVVGRVRNILGGEVDLAAAQFVLKLDTGPFSWSTHLDRWQLSWNAAGVRLRALPTQRGDLRQRMSMEAVGASGTWHAVLPLEARWFRSRNPESLETSEEVQVLAGSRERLYWPQLAFTWQRLSSTGTLYPVNGDEWWFYRRARGPRFDVSMPFPGHWVATLVYLRQQADGDAYQITRTMLVLVKRF